MYSNVPSPSNEQIKQLAVLNDEYGDQYIKEQINEFFSITKLPGKSPSTKRTLKNFIEVVQEI
ncbi:hypothetical protein [Neobacillus sp. CF12]|uniref:hypothetical protein n=1 Tax=Neobacillus sp. CF12 TaxID=3055864 RepID=UPI0025A20042|nr:hypothetical protein [Neobacillus sp. CF12]MDM5330429.1 hypothetical protein [Neobacillus sp. CF12]